MGVLNGDVVPESYPVKIELMYDGWRIYIHNRVYTWDHDDPDMGTEAIATLLSDIGYDVSLEEIV